MKKVILFFAFLVTLSGCGHDMPDQGLAESPTNQTTSNEPSATSTALSVSPTPESGLNIGSKMISDKDMMTLVYVPKGDFLMGMDSSTLAVAGSGMQMFYDARPQHKVSLSAYWIDQTEVTNKQYAMCVLDGICAPPSILKSPTRSSYYGDPKFDNYPVVYMDWNSAEVYCEWANRRLPTEAEWEKAARGTDGRIYPWGNDEPNDSLLNYDSLTRDTAEVGSYPAGKSVYDAYDMAGNVWEWVEDWYNENYYANSSALDPSGPNTGEARGLRGGSWYFDPNSLRSNFRYGVIPANMLVRSDVRSWSIPQYEDISVYGKTTHGFGTVGFRCALSATP